MVYNLSEVTGKKLAYVTEEQIRGGIFTEATVVPFNVSADEACAEFIKKAPAAAPENNTGREYAYEWRGIGARIGADKPCCWVLSYEDFYTSEQYDSRNITCGAEEGNHFKQAEFSLTFRGVHYEDCSMLLVIRPPEEQGTEIKAFFRVPAGYDGCVLGFHNSAALTDEQLKLAMSNPAAALGFIARSEGDLYIRLK